MTFFLLALVCSTSIALASEVISSLDPAPPGFDFTQEAETVVVIGSWLGTPEPLNVARLVADHRKNTISVATTIIVTKLLPKAPFLTLEQEDFEIESWTGDTVTSKRTRCGTSNRFVQIVLDLRRKSVEQRYSGEYPAMETLGDGTEQFKRHFAGTYQPK